MSSNFKRNTRLKKIDSYYHKCIKFELSLSNKNEETLVSKKNYKKKMHYYAPLNYEKYAKAKERGKRVLIFLRKKGKIKKTCCNWNRTFYDLKQSV